MKQQTVFNSQRIILFLILFLAGASALINQIVWIRKFGLVFGIDVYTMGTVLSAFMGGLALGSLIFGRMADKAKNPLKLFLFLEFGIGVFAILFPVSFNALIKLYTSVIQSFSLSPNGEQMVKFVFSFFYLLIPTTLMGGTLPVIFKYFIRELKTLGWNIGYLYSINNLGAVIGCFLTGFFTIRLFGLNNSLYIGAALNLINALLLLYVSKTVNPGFNNNVNATAVNSNSIILSKPLMRLVLWIFAIEGFTTLALEILWTRILVGYSYDKTTYFSSVIILSFIFGLSLGSILVVKWVDKSKKLVSALAFIELFIGLSSLILLILFAEISLNLNLKRSMFESWFGTIGKEYIMFFFILLIPAMLTGMVYPIVSKLYNDNLAQVGKKMGNIGFLDTVGSILGSFAAGFILIPYLGVVKSFVFVVIINVLLGLLLLVFNNSLKKRVRALMVTGATTLTIFLILKAPDNKYFNWWDRSRVQIWTNFIEEIPFYHEGADATVTIREYNNYYSLNINGHNTAFTTVRDQIANKMLGYIPYMLHQNPEHALVIGFGLGFTVLSLVQDEIELIDVAEISEGVIKSGHSVNKWNNNVIDNPKVKVHLEDGRGFLNKTSDKFDIITSNAIHPRLSNNIYTRDFYQLCQNKLNKNGIMCQWATPNWMTELEYKAQVKAFAEVFKYCQLWYLNEYSTILIGCDSPIKIDYELISKRFERPKVIADLQNIFMTEPHVFTSQYSLEKDDLLKYCNDAPSNTDDFPIVEFSRIVNIAPDSMAMDFLSRQKVDFGKIVFNQQMKEQVKDSLIKKMYFLSDIRKYQMKEVVADARRQETEYFQMKKKKSI